MMAKKNNLSGLNSDLLSVVAIVVLIVVVGLGGHLLGRYDQKKQVAPTPQVEAVQTVSYNGEDGKTALDLLKEKEQIETQESSIGTFVLSINNVPNTSENYWMFYVNNELAPVGADQYQSKSSDKIEWRYEKVQ